VTLFEAGQAQAWITTSAVQPGASSIPVSSQTPNFAYTAAAKIS